MELVDSHRDRPYFVVAALNREEGFLVDELVGRNLKESVILLLCLSPYFLQRFSLLSRFRGGVGVTLFLTASLRLPSRSI